MNLQLFEANPKHLAYVGSQPGPFERNNNDWHTPSYLIEHARQIMGSIDLDPFSSIVANTRVKAEYFFDAENSALTQPWCSKRQKRLYPFGLNVWMNPPYSADILSKAIEMLITEGRKGHISQAIVLVNNAMETRWFRRLSEATSIFCSLWSRVAFEAPDGKAMSGNTRGQVLAYLPFQCDETKRFFEEFRFLGLCFEERKED